MTRARVTRPAAAFPAASRSPETAGPALASVVGNRAMGRILARAPGDKPPPKQPRFGPELTPQEMWEHVHAARGFAGRVPPHAAAEADTRAGLGQVVLEDALADLTEARHDALAGSKGAVTGAGQRANKALTGVRKAVTAAGSARANASESVTPIADAEALHEDALADLTEARHELVHQRDRGDQAAASAAEQAVTSAAERADTTLTGVRETVNRRQLGHGVSTYGAVQVLDEKDRNIAFAGGAFEDLHAEEHALADVRMQLEALGFRPGEATRSGWRVVIVVDQVVCGRCRRALRQFANDYGIDHADVVAHYPQRSAGSAVTPKTASSTAPLHPTEVPAGPGEQVLLTEPPGEGGPQGGEGGPSTPPASAPPPPSAPAVGPTASAPSASASTEPPGSSATELAEELAAKERWTRRMAMTA
ncbi:MAG TPA: hypothetical protein VH418_19310, partial [Solirubrobacteraceae bacterium]